MQLTTEYPVQIPMNYFLIALRYNPCGSAASIPYLNLSSCQPIVLVVSEQSSLHQIFNIACAPGLQIVVETRDIYVGCNSNTVKYGQGEGLFGLECTHVPTLPFTFYWHTQQVTYSTSTL